jgi:hypothetical protein
VKVNNRSPASSRLLATAWHLRNASSIVTLGSKTRILFAGGGDDYTDVTESAEQMMAFWRRSVVLIAGGETNSSETRQHLLGTMLRLSR